MKWVKDVPKEYGFYWVGYCGYEHPEVAYFIESGLYLPGQKEPSNLWVIEWWSDKPIERPENNL